MTRGQPFDTIRLNQREIESLLNVTERPTSSTPGSLRRRMRRWSLNGRRVVLTLAIEPSGYRNFISSARNLSSSGISVIHGGFVHTGTRCMISLRATDGGVVTANASIVRCRHMQKHLHDLGVRFDQPIDPRRVIDFGETSVFLCEQVDLSALKGRTLIVDDSRSFQKLLTAYLEGSNLDLVFVNDGEAGLQCLNDHPSLVLVDYRLPGMNGIEMIRAARASGFDAPMVLLTAETTPGLRESALNAGATEVIQKPCSADVIRQAAAEYLADQHGDAKAIDQAKSAPPVTITLDMAREFAESLRDEAEAMINAIEKSDVARLRDLAQRVLASAGGFGFPEAAAAATAALQSLDATQSLTDSLSQLQRMVDVCLNAPASPRAKMPMKS